MSLAKEHIEKSLGGRYEIERLLGRGGSGLVFLCRDRVLAKLPVALKIIPECNLGNAAAKERVCRELRALHRIQSSHVVQMYSPFSKDGFVGYTMEYVDGPNLREHLEQSPPLDFYEVKRYLTQIAKGLIDLHQAKIIHRDLKLENIVLSKDRCIKIMDLGIANFWKSDSQELLHSGMFRLSTRELSSYISKATATGRVVGTLEYLPPEYLQHGAYDKRFDIYCLGIVAFELITGRNPFSGMKDFEMIEAKVNGSLPLPSQFRAHVPPEFDALCQRALAKNPKERYSSVGEFLHALSQVQIEPQSIQSLKTRNELKSYHVDLKRVSERENCAKPIPHLPRYAGRVAQRIQLVTTSPRMMAIAAFVFSTALLLGVVLYSDNRTIASAAANFIAESISFGVNSKGEEPPSMNSKQSSPSRGSVNTEKYRNVYLKLPRTKPSKPPGRE